jgi:hypothetical protein
MLDDASLTLEPARPPADPPLRKNLVADGGFEGAGDEWEYSIPPYPGIKAELDNTVKLSGRSSLRFTSPRAAMVPGPAGVAQVFCDRGFAGKRVRFSAYIKPDSLRSSAYVKVLCKTTRGLVQDVSKTQIAGTMDWTKAELEMDVPPDTCAVWTWITYTAPARGRVFFDDATFEVLGPASDTRGAR